MLPRLRILTLPVLCLFAPPASLSEPPTGAELRSDCMVHATEPEAPEARRCLAYVQGFVDGAIAIDVRVARDAADASTPGETFSERARRTRVRDRRTVPGAPHVCIAESVAMEDVAEAVISHLTATKAEVGETAAGAVRAALRARYPCQ